MFSPGSEWEELQEAFPGLRPSESPESADSIPTEENLRNFSLFPSILAPMEDILFLFHLFLVIQGLDLEEFSEITGKFWSFSSTLGFSPSRFFTFHLFLEIQASTQEKFGIFLPLATNLPLTTWTFRSFSTWFWKFLPQCEIFCPFSAP